MIYSLLAKVIVFAQFPFSQYLQDKFKEDRTIHYVSHELSEKSPIPVLIIPQNTNPKAILEN
jgi:hypothetical protein